MVSGELLLAAFARPVVLWFRQDLRLADNPALDAAVATGAPVVPVYIWGPAEEGDWPPGQASQWFLHHALESLGADLSARGSRLVIRKGDAQCVLNELVNECGARKVFFNRRYEPSALLQEQAVIDGLVKIGVESITSNSALIFEPNDVATREGRPFKVFTPFYRACLMLPEPLPTVRAPKAIPFPDTPLRSDSVAGLDLLPRIKWDTGLQKTWMPGEAGALRLLKTFINDGLVNYRVDRDRPDRDGVSKLSPYLHFGCIGPRQIWRAVRSHVDATGSGALVESADIYLKELIWREFAYHLLFHFPHSVHKPLRPEFERFPKSASAAEFVKSWQEGLTGYPIVDAGMRELWHTGWMHNRVRMIVASFLVKDLLAPWTDGARWFWDTLVDADLASNTLGWQWSAGCGSDAAPYFRIFNPILQGQKFDPDGVYVRKWIPELAAVPDRWIHSPFAAPPLVLQSAGVTLGQNYPAPLVDHALARNHALDAFAMIKGKK